MISIRTTEYNPSINADLAFKTNMFSRTNSFALFDQYGRIKVQTASMSPSGLKVSHVQSTGHYVDLIEDSAVTILLPSSGQLRVRIAAAEYRVVSNSACIFGPNARRTRAEASQTKGLFSANALMIPQARLRELVQLAGNDGAGWKGLRDVLPLASKLPQFRRLSDLSHRAV